MTGRQSGRQEEVRREERKTESGTVVVRQKERRVEIRTRGLEDKSQEETRQDFIRTMDKKARNDKMTKRQKDRRQNERMPKALIKKGNKRRRWQN